MLPKPLKKLLGRQADYPTSKARVPKGARYYVIGDIHGRLDLFKALLAAIERDNQAKPSARMHIILLGDLIDRGPDSAKVLAIAREWQKHRSVRILTGNHEEMFLKAFDDPAVCRQFFKLGGRETLISYGVSAREFKDSSIEKLAKRMRKVVPKQDRKFIKTFEDMIVAGDYVFVHAGINPERPLEDQDPADLRWIRTPFLKHKGDFPKVVVHGHTITNDIVDDGKRIGLDTGAYRSGVLTALVLEGNTRRLLQARKKYGAVRVESREYVS